MKILVACEESGIVTMAFRSKGHKAYSCDIMSTLGVSKWHIQCDVREVLYDDWDMVIAFPPCTHICAGGNAYRKAKREDGREQQGIDFFMLFTCLACSKVAIENPLGVMSTFYRKPDQIIHPWQFGHKEQKRTCLWLKGLPKLQPTNVISEKVEWVNSTNFPRNIRHVMRSKTFEGVAKAMSEQGG